MHIYICRNCGKLTESEKDEKVCQSCGAQLDPVPPGSSETIRLPSAQQSASRSRPPQPQAGQTRPPQPRQPSTIPPTSSSSAPSQAPARSTQARPVELPSSATPPPQAGRPPPRPVSLPSASTPPPSAREQLKTVESGAEEPEPTSESKPAVAGEESTEGTITPTQIPVDAGTEGLEMYENKDLVACPQCGYGCDPNWGKCPLCDAQISGTGELKKITEMDFTADESSFTKGLVPCPKCQYACDPSWGTCPICNTELKKPETAPASNKPDTSEKAEKPE